MTAWVGAAPQGAAGRDGTEGDALALQLRMLGLVLLLMSPALLGVGGSALRLLFPAAAFVLGLAFVLNDRVTAYMGLTLWLFVLTPLARRLVDLDTGYQQVNLLMLAPYAAASASLLALPALLRPGRVLPGGNAFLLLAGAAGYGLVLAIAGGRLSSGIFDAMRWVFPPCFALLLVLSRPPLPVLRAHLEAFFALALILTGLYGLFQFLAAPAWDAYWMTQSEMNSIGSPEPYRIRVFSTLNSPGSYSFYLLGGLLLIVASRSKLWAPALALGLVALALTLVRSTWLAFVLGLLVMAAAGPARARPRILALGLAAALAAPLALAHPEVGPLIEERLTSLTRLAGDVSAFERANGYAFLLAELDEAPFGAGLAVNGTYASYADGGRSRVIDGGPIEIFLALGLLGGAAYLLAIARLLFLALRQGLARPELAGYAATCIASLLLLSSGTTTIGEIGMVFWVCMAVLLSAGLRPAYNYNE